MIVNYYNIIKCKLLNSYLYPGEANQLIRISMHISVIANCYCQCLQVSKYAITIGLLLISFTVINEHLVIQSDLEITYLFTVLIITKSIIAINYLYRIKVPKSRLQ